MINPSEINPLTLPSVPLESRRDLPTDPCIYFAIDGQGLVQYVGKAKNLRNRWGGHHHYNDFTRMSNVRIAYIAVDVDLLSAVERSFIEWIAPPLNGRKRCLVKKKRLSASIPRKLYERLESMARFEGRSISNLAVHLLEVELAKRFS